MGKEIQELSFGYLKFKMTVKCFQVELSRQLKIYVIIHEFSREVWIGDVNLTRVLIET